MNAEPFFTGNSYISPPYTPHFFARLFPTLVFYGRTLKTLICSGMTAKKAPYTGELWVQHSVEVLRSLESIGVRVHVEGVEHFRMMEEPCIFVGNHMSTLETFILPAIVQPFKDVTFVVKQSLIEYPFFRHVLRARDPIVVSRTNLRADLTAMLDGGARRIEQGRSLIVFPQSTRSLTFNPDIFNSVGTKIARRSGAPIIPLALKTDAWKPGTIIKDFGPFDPKLDVYFRFGAPIHVHGSGKEEHAQICDFIQSALAEWEQNEKNKV